MVFMTAVQDFMMGLFGKTKQADPKEQVKLEIK